MSKIASLTRRPRRLVLNRRKTLVLDNAQGTIISVDRGCLWVTLERDLRDIVLAKGMRFQIDRSGRTILAAETDSTLRLLAPETTRDPAGNRESAGERNPRRQVRAGRYDQGCIQRRRLQLHQEIARLS